MKTLSEIRAAREEAALQTKLAAVQETLGDDPVVVETLDRAIDIVKEAGVANPEEVLDIATQMTIDRLGLDKQAAADDATDEDVAIATEAGVDAARAAHAAGVTCDDVAKIASAEEEDLFGRMLAHLTLQGG